MALMRCYSSRKSGGITTILNTPGVGQYNLRTNFVSPRVTGGRFGHDKRDSYESKGSLGPGPANAPLMEVYRSLKNCSPRATIGKEKRGKTNLMRHSQKVGPATYNIAQSTPRGSISFPKAIRNEFIRETSPGPHVYNTIDSSRLTKQNMPSFKIGTGPKHEELPKLKKSIPGPGIYELPS